MLFDGWATTTCSGTGKTRKRDGIPMMGNGKWYRDGLRFSCTRCGTCCKVNGDYAFVYVTSEEAEAIMEFLNIPRKEFMKSYCSRLEGSMIIKFQNDVCPFLENDSCSIYKVRPVQCRAWPFWEENLDEWIWFEEVAAICPGANRGKRYPAGEIEKICRRVNRHLDIESETL
jgi:Fe-S-cluster containining protein